MTPDDNSVTQATREWYSDFYGQKGLDRNDLLRNPEVLFQALAFKASVISALGSIQLDPASARILDVGCGMGGSTLNFLWSGFDPTRIYGIDILEERISVARKTFPNINWTCGDASSMSFPDEHFDVVFESMFTQITDDDLGKQIASEMLRVTKSNGYIILASWRYSKPNNRKYKGLSKTRISSLFNVGSGTDVLGVHKGMLIPPVGRLISKHMHSIYFGVRSVLPFLVGQVATVLQKKAPTIGARKAA